MAAASSGEGSNAPSPLAFDPPLTLTGAEGALAAWDTMGEDEATAAGFERIEVVPRPGGWSFPEQLAVFLEPTTGDMVSSEGLRAGHPSFSLTGSFVGLNAVKFYFEENGRASKFGTVAEIFADLQDLGVSFARQTGFADLEWPGDDVVVADSSVTSSSTLASYLSSTLRAQARAPLTDVLTAAHAAGVKLSLTFLRIAAGGAWAGTADLSASPPTDPLASGAAGVQADTLAWLNFGERGATLAFDLDTVYAHADGSTTWGIDEYLDFDDTEGSYDVSDATGNEASWVWSTVDPRSPFKLAVIKEIAEQWVYVLSQVCASLGIALSEVVTGTELCNEVNRKNVVLDWRGSPSRDQMTGWARVIAAAAAGFEAGFATYPECRVPLNWPSLAEYTSDPSVGTFTRSGALHSTTGFLAGLVAATDAELARYGLTLSALSGLDYHVYHYSRSAGGLQATRMLYDVNYLREMMAARGLGGNVTVGESGCPAFDEATASDLTEDYPALYDAIFFGNDFSGTEQFQAREVWRRLATHLAAGVPLVAWQTHVATDSSTSASSTSAFQRTGLRVDDGADRGATPADAAPRLSWWALRRLARLLTPRGYGVGDAAGGAVGAVLRGTLGERSAPSLLAQGTADALVVLQFLTANRAEFLYVAFVDPTATWADTVTLLTYVDGVSSYTPVLGEQLDVLPADLTTVATGGFPAPAMGDRVAGTSVSINAGVFRLTRDGDPLLLRTPYRLEFWPSGPSPVGSVRLSLPAVSLWRR